MNNRIFHCGTCHRLGPAAELDSHGLVCPGCGELLTDKEVKGQVTQSQSQPGRKPSGKSRSEGRRRSSVLENFHDEEAEEHRRSNLVLISAVSLLMLLGLGFAAYKYYEDYFQKLQFAKGTGTTAKEIELSSYVELDRENDEEKPLFEFFENYLKVFYSEPLISRRTPLIADSGQFAGRFESYYVRNDDSPVIDELTIESVFRTRLSPVPAWMVRVKFGKTQRDFVFKAKDEGVLVDWPHMVGLGREKWESFLKREVSAESVFRVYAWVVQSNVDEGVILLRMAAPLFTGQTALAEVTPILQIPRESEVGKRLEAIFEELPPETDEIGFPQGPRLDEKMRQLTVRLRIEGQVKKQPALSLSEVIAGDWVDLTDENRQQIPVNRERLKTLISSANEAKGEAKPELQVPELGKENEAESGDLNGDEADSDDAVDQ